MAPVMTEINRTRQHAELRHGNRRELGIVGDFLTVVPPYLHVLIEFLALRLLSSLGEKIWMVFPCVIRQLCSHLIIWTTMG